MIIRVGMDDEDLPPLTFAGLRYAAAAVVLGVVTAPTESPRRGAHAVRAALGRLAVLGVVFYAVNQGAVFVAIEAQPVATTSLVLSLTPLLVAAASGPLLGEPPSQQPPRRRRPRTDRGGGLPQRRSRSHGRRA